MEVAHLLSEAKPVWSLRNRSHQVKLHKPNQSLAFRNSLFHSLSLPFSVPPLLPSSFIFHVHSCALHNDCPAKLLFKTVYDWSQPWANCCDWTSLGVGNLPCRSFHLTGCCVRLDAMVKQSVQRHNGLGFSLWEPPLYHTPLPAHRINHYFTKYVSIQQGIFWLIYSLFLFAYVFRKQVMCSNWGYYTSFTTAELPVMHFESI